MLANNFPTVIPSKINPSITNATEVSVLNNLARKSNILKETLDVQRESGIVFPGDFPKEEEE